MIDDFVENTWSVYAHITPNNKYYIGITSLNPIKRWGNNGIHYKSQMFYRAIRKYGWDNIEHHIIASNITKDEATNFEIILIDKLQTTNGECGYNLTNGGEGVNGFKHSQETIDKIISVNTGRRFKHTDETKRKIGQANKGKYMKAVRKLDLERNIIMEYDSIKSASECTGVNAGGIGYSANGLRKTSGGYIWEFIKECD